MLGYYLCFIACWVNCFYYMCLNIILRLASYLYVNGYTYLE